MALAQMQILYGPPPGLVMPLYGSNFSRKPPSLSSQILTTIISLLLNPIFITISFIVGVILYLFTHKKIFIIIPLILAIFFLLGQFFGVDIL